MTTRRRRTGSDCVEVSAVGGTNQPSLVQQNPSVPNPQYPQVVNIVGARVPWVGSAGGIQNSDAYYKKTDGINYTSNTTDNINFSEHSPQNWISTPWQQGTVQTGLTTNISVQCDLRNNNLYNSRVQQLQTNNITGTTPFWQSTGSGSVGQTFQNSSSTNTVSQNGGSVGYKYPNNSVGYTYPNNSVENAWSSNSAGQLWSNNSDLDTGDMASRDRTQEFLRIVRSQQGNQTNGTLPYKDGKRPRDLAQYSEFMQRSKLIGRNISSTYAKLEKLTHLAKNRSLFDDSQDREIQELTGIIRHDLNSLTKQLEDLRKRSRIANHTTNGTGHLQKHSANLVGSLQTKVASIAQQFKDVLEVRTENLKKQAERREQFTGSAVSGELPPGAMAGHHQGSVLLADEAAAALYNGTPITDSQGGGQVAINMGGSNTYQQQLHLMEEQDTYLQSRADTMRTIESTIVELGQMFSELATMVKEQEELVHRIDANVDDADLNVEAAHTELLKYFKSVSSNRWLMIKVFGIIILFFVVFIVFMA